MVALGGLLVNALALSALYAIVAVGFTLIFGVGGVLNFTHAAFISVGAFTAYQVSNPNQWGLSIHLGFLLAILVTAAVGAAIYRLAIRHVKAKSTVGTILTIVLAFFLLYLLRGLYGTGGISVPSPLPGVVTIPGLGYTVQRHLVFVFVLSWAFIGGLFYLVNRTTIGKAIEAVSMSEKGAVLAGIDADRINMLTWILAAGFGGAAGVLLVGFQGGDWLVGFDPLVISFGIVILGGLGSIKGSVVGAHVIGVLETATVTLVDPALTGLSSLLLLLVVLMVKPTGLFGHEHMEGV